MFCSKCGSRLSGGIFCHNCGSRVAEHREPEPAEAQAVSNEPEEIIPPPPEPPEIKHEIPEPPVLPVFPDSPRLSSLSENGAIPEKQYFGKPALIFCFTVIGILSVACGILSALHFGGF